VAMFDDETQSHKRLEGSVQPRLLPPSVDAEAQRKRMLMALGILLLALVAVIIKDWDFWFPTRIETPEEAARKSKALPVDSSNAPSTTAHERKGAKSAGPEVASGQVPGFSATTERAALPPLQVEVIAGNQRVSIPAKSGAIHVDVGSGITGPGAFESATVSPGGVRVSPQAAQNVSMAVPPDYPLLARQMKVQGVVSLQALIARDGTIQELQILSGPEILAAAAREAVKQWHFKPYLQNGQPVETQARITVNFTISTN
jgi:TonB family protein